MFKSVKHILPGGSVTVTSQINPRAVLWIEASRKGEIGQSHVALLGEAEKAQTTGKMSLGHPLEQVREMLAPSSVPFTRDDRAGRPEFQKLVYVVPEHIRLIVPVNDFFEIQFSDGSVLGVKDIGAILDKNNV